MFIDGLPAPSCSGAPRPRWAHHNAVLRKAQPDGKGAADYIPDNGQVERMNRTIKEAPVKRYHYDRHEQLKNHLSDFINAYNYARLLKTLKGLTPDQFIVKAWKKNPNDFNLIQPIKCRD